MKLVSSPIFFASLGVLAFPTVIANNGVGMGQGTDNPNAKNPSPEEIMALWTPERRRAAITRDVAIHPESGKAFVRERSGMVPFEGEGPHNLFDRNLRGVSGGAGEDFLAPMMNQEEAEGSSNASSRYLQTSVKNGFVPDPTPGQLRAVGRLWFCLGSNACYYSCSGKLHVSEDTSLF